MKPDQELFGGDAIDYARARRMRRRTRAGILLAVVLQASAAGSQTASTVTPDSFEPPPQRQLGALVFSGEPGLNAPAGADQFSVLISGVAVDGTLPGLEDETAALEARLTRGRIAVSEIFDAATKLEEAYVNEGFVLARIVVPAQTLVDGGSLRLVVVDGFVESIDDSAVPARVRDRLAQLTAPLVGKRGLKLPELERRILLAGDTYGVALGTALATGTSPGGTIVILEPEFKSVTGFVGFDNAQTDALGEWTVDAGVEFNGYFGRGEVIYVRGSAYPADLFGNNGVFSSSPRLRTLAFGGVVPLNAQGLSLNLEIADSRSTPVTAGPATQSEFQRYSARLYYPVVRSRSKNISVQLSFDAQSDSQKIVAGNLPVYEDRTRVLRAGIDGFWVLDDGSIADAGAILSFGLEGFGARSAADAVGGTPLSRAGADAQFAKLELSGRYRRQIQEVFEMSLSGRAQYSFAEPLVTGEQFGVANARELSSFGEGAISGDSGWSLRAELARPVQATYQDRPVTLRPYAFAAAGAVYREFPEVGEASIVRATSYGLGIEAFMVRDPSFSNASLRLELSNGNRSDGGVDGTRVSLSGSFRF